MGAQLPLACHLLCVQPWVTYPLLATESSLGPSNHLADLATRHVMVVVAISIFLYNCLFLKFCLGRPMLTLGCVDPIDAILLPLFAGISLASLYFLIKWLEDPALLNKILNWYFAVFGVWSLARMISDSMGTLTSFVHPKIYDKGDKTLEIDDFLRESTLNRSSSVEQKSRVHEPSAASSLSFKATNTMRTLRELLSQQLDVRVYIHQTVQARFKIGLQGITSFFLAVVGVLYFNLIGKPWWLTNILGFSFAYSALQIMSPTTSWTGTLILGALFIYSSMIYISSFSRLSWSPWLRNSIFQPSSSFLGQEDRLKTPQSRPYLCWGLETSFCRA